MPGQGKLIRPVDQGQDSSSEEDGGGQGHGRAEDGGAAVVAGCKTSPVLQPGKESLDSVTHSLHLLVVMDWLLPAATGGMPCWASILRISSLPYPWSPSIAAAGARSLRTPSAPVKSLHCPSPRWSRRGPPLLWQTPWNVLVMPPWCHQSGGDQIPLVEAGHRGMGLGISGVNHQDPWLWGIRRLRGIGC